jgi:peptidoglycan/LPS O-acetylase OafA/YrhL
LRSLASESASTPGRAEDRFYALDVLRGLAALSVVFWHWHHFRADAPGGPGPVDARPLHGVFFLFYGHGLLAVDLFFSLSGFVFFWLYAGSIASGATSAREFWVRRFSRLYPLHLLTLLGMAAGQLVFVTRFGHPFVYGNNDLRHFLLNLGFASSWGLERGFSFNAPAWSVSVEVFLYALFFALCRWCRVNLGVVIVLAVLGFAFAQGIYQPLGRGIGGFFMGGAAYFAYRRIVAQGRARHVARVLAGGTLLAWGCVLVATNRDFGLELPARLALPVRAVVWLWPRAILFPLTILTLALLEPSVKSVGKKLAFVGDISFSSYLLHYPLQLVVTAFALSFSLDPKWFDTPFVLIGFFALLIALSLVSHRFFELPAQRFLRKRLALRVPARSAHDSGAQKSAS